MSHQKTTADILYPSLWSFACWVFNGMYYIGCVHLLVIDYCLLIKDGDVFSVCVLWD